MSPDEREKWGIEGARSRITRATIKDLSLPPSPHLSLSPSRTRWWASGLQLHSMLVSLSEIVPLEILQIRHRRKLKRNQGGKGNRFVGIV